MNELFNKFLKDQKPNLFDEPSKISIAFNRWITALGNARNKRIVNEANLFMIKKFITKAKFSHGIF